MTDYREAFSALQQQRRSVRAFLPSPLEQTLLDAVFKTAQRAPSNCNTQPWRVAVVSGERLETLRGQLPEAFSAGQWTLDFPYEGNYEGVYQQRQYAAAKALYDAAGIVREDKPARQQQFMRNFEFFGAPHVALLFLPAPFGLREAADLGMYAQNLMLSMTAHGLASCPQTALSFHADLLRQTLDISDDNKLLFGISFGYADPEAPVNRCNTERAALDDSVTFYR